MPGSIIATSWSSNRPTYRELFTDNAGAMTVTNASGSVIAVANNPDIDAALGGVFRVFDAGGTARSIDWESLVAAPVRVDLYTLAYQITSGGALACMIASSTLGPLQYPGGTPIPGNVHQWPS